MKNFVKKNLCQFVKKPVLSYVCKLRSANFRGNFEVMTQQLLQFGRFLYVEWC